MYRLLALIGAASSSNSLWLLPHLAVFIPVGYETEAAEAVLPVPQVFSGIPKTIEAMQLVRAELDRRQHSLRERGEKGRREALSERRQQSRPQLQAAIGALADELVPLWAQYDDPQRPPPDPSLSLSANYPSLPAPAANAADPSASTSDDLNPTSLRISRGLTALTSVYSSSAPKLLSSLHALHPSLHHSVLQHIYGAVLCTPLLPLACIELISVACLLFERNPRQLFSHLRGALLNGCSSAMCSTVMSDAATLYREAARREQQAGMQYVDDALLMLRKIDRKIGMSQQRPAAAAGDDMATPAQEQRQVAADLGDGSSSSSPPAAPAAAPPAAQRSHSQPLAAKL